jgi:hypothetical protein
MSAMEVVVRRVFVLSTFDTDHLLVEQADFQRAVGVPGWAGHPVCR